MGVAGSRPQRHAVILRRHDSVVAATEEVAPGHALVTFASDLGESAEPGQFVQVAFDGVAGAFLPRPFSFHSTSPDQFQVLSRTVGPGTAALAAAVPGDRLSVLGPLGQGFELTRPLADGYQLLLVGGGVGVPPLHHVADFVRAGAAGAEVAGARIRALIGAATADLLLAVDALRALDVDVTVSTDDGSAGRQGLVTDLLTARLADASGGAATGDGATSGPLAVLACGPHPMLRAVAELCDLAGAACQVAMEQPMACGYGVCLGCAIPATAPGGNGAGRYLLLCQDGPVLDAREVVW